MAKRTDEKKSASGELKPEKCPAGMKLLREFEPHGGLITGISFRPGGRQFVTASTDETLKIWDTDSGECLQTLTGHSDDIGCCEWSPQQERNEIASGGQDGVVRIWDPVTGECRKSRLDTAVSSVAWSNDALKLAVGKASAVEVWDQGIRTATFDKHSRTVYSCRFVRGGTQVISASGDHRVRIWTADGKHTVRNMQCGTSVFDVSVDDNGGQIAAACEDGTLQIWQRNSKSLVLTSATVLEGHTDSVRSCEFSSDGRLLASKADDETVRLWRTDTWQTVAILQESGGIGWDTLCFHPTQPILATAGVYDRAVRLWELDYKLLLTADQSVAIDRPKPVHYTTARIALVGDSGVGKTGLGWRLAHGEFKEHPSTHGQQFWVVDSLGKTRNDGTQCEAVLWDFAGQDDYRLVHSLFLKDVDLGLLLFDPGKRDKPMSGVEFWVKQLRHAEKPLLKTMLIAARCDKARPNLTEQELTDFCNERHISGGYIATSAMSNEGMKELLARVRDLIPWDEMTTTVTTSTFKRVKDFVLNLKESRGNEEKTAVLVTPSELRTLLEKTDSQWEFTDAEMITAVKHLANHGYVTICQQRDELMLEGDAESSLPPLLQKTVFVDFTRREEHFAKLFDLVLTLHRIDFDHRGVVEIRRELGRLDRR